MTFPAESHPDFRSDINGLRAWAVVVVVLYHFGVPGFNGGYVGVDIFFVISGFLMTGIVITALEGGHLSVFGFYMARARRIVPALIFMCAMMLLLGWFVLLPPEYKTLSTHVFASAAFVANFKYWNEAGYFDLASHEKWLLHTWSLSVEWQFYIILPMFLWLVWRLRPSRTALQKCILTGFVVSLAFSIWTTNSSPTTAFFMLHTRAWELLGGGLVFLFGKDMNLSESNRRRLELAGLILIMTSVVLFDRHTAWPGWRAIVPVAATMLVIAASHQSQWTGNKVAQWLGDRSYSLYLWHWPVYVALVYTERQEDILSIFAGILITLFLCNLSFLWVENPARRLFGPPRSRTTGAALLSILVALLGISLYLRGHEGVAGRFSSAVELVAAEANDFNPRRGVCHPHAGPSSPSCVYGGQEWKVIAVGDSHAGALVSGIAQAQPHGDSGVVQWSYSGCPFIAGLKKIRKLNENYQCKEFIEWANATLDTLPTRIPVVIIGRYAQAAFGPNEDHLSVDVPEVYFSNSYPRTTPQFLDEFARHITESACQLASHRTVYMVRPIPEMGMDVPKIMSRRMAWGLRSEISVPIEQYRKRNAWVWAAQDAARDKCGVKILDPTAILCDAARCYGSKDGRPLYHDDNHLSEFGNKLLTPMFAEVFNAN